MQFILMQLEVTSPLQRIESHPHEAKRLIGIEYEQFLALVALAEERHLHATGRNCQNQNPH